MKYVTLQVLSSQDYFTSVKVFWFFVVFCLFTFLCAVNCTFLTKDFKSIIGFCDKTTYKTVIKVTDSYLFIQKYIFGSSELVHVCWIFRWFFNTFSLIFFLSPQKCLNLGREEGRPVLLMYLSDNDIGCLLNFWAVSFLVG